MRLHGLRGIGAVCATISKQLRQQVKQPKSNAKFNSLATAIGNLTQQNLILLQKTLATTSARQIKISFASGCRYTGANPWFINVYGKH